MELYEMLLLEEKERILRKYGYKSVDEALKGLSKKLGIPLEKVTPRCHA